MNTSAKLSAPKTTTKDYFRKEKRMLKMFGISFTGGESLAYKIYSFLIIFPFNGVYPFLDFMEIFKHDFEIAADMMIYVFAAFISLAKTLVLLRNRILIGKMLDKLEEKPFTINLERGGEHEEKILTECIWITDVQTRLYWMFSFLTIISTASYTVIQRVKDQKRELPYGPLTVVNVSYSLNYEITWLYQNMCITGIVCHFTTTDLLMAAVLAHISYQFKILQNNIKRIVINSNTDMLKMVSISEKVPLVDANIDGSKIPWNILHQSLKNTVEYHLAILNLAEELESVFSLLLLLVFLGTLGMLCFLIYHVSMLKNPIQTVRTLGEISSAILQVATICYWGEQVMFESQEVGRAAFEINFAGTDIRFQKSLALIIRRSQNSTKLTAGKFTDICLKTFSWVLRTSYSAFMVLRSNNSD